MSDSYEPIIDGVSLVVKNYAYWLNKLNSTASVVAPDVHGYTEQNSEIKVYRYKSMKIPRRPPYRIGVPIMEIPLVKRLANENFDLLHSHCPFATGTLASLMHERRGIPHITTFHSKYKEDFQQVLKNKALTDIALKLALQHYTKADYVWVPNESTGETLKSYGYKGSFEVWPNGTDMKVPSALEYKSYREQGMKQSGSKEGVLTLLFVGQHIWEKNTRLIIDALILLKNRDVPFYMIFAGKGFARAEMEKLVIKNDLFQYVKFMGHIDDRETLKGLYAASDIFLFPSIYDNAPLVLREAAAFSVPSIVAKGSNSSKDVGDEIGGFHTVPEKQALAQLIKDLEQNRKRIKTVGKGAQQTVYASWETIIPKVKDRYAEILDENKKKKT
ncbi:MAG: glycosyltransferase [Spirochaetaceae bacterium]|nr:glycosyltransferase [Spirochaetaceae bacterium]